MWWRLVLLLFTAAQARGPLREIGWGLFGGWLAAALGDLSWYVGDARALELPLVSMGGEGDDHDWNYLLRTFDLLRSDLAIAAQLRRVGDLIWFGSLVGGLVACWRRWQGRRSVEAPSR